MNTGSDYYFDQTGSEQVERVIARLAGERLLTTSGQGPASPDENFVEVSHEALIREWPLLREWLSETREDLRLGRGLQQSAEEWEVLKRDPSALLRGVKLTQAEEWTAKHPHASAAVMAYVSASLDARCKSEEVELARSRELQEEREARKAAEQTNAELREKNRRLEDQLAKQVAKVVYQFQKESAAGSPLIDARGVEERPYGAFFLYSQLKDRALAASLQASLERFAKPWYRTRRLRIFRDETNLSATSDLWLALKSALDKSKYIVLLASPEAANSTWVNAEIEYWLEHRQETEILIALTGGQLLWDKSVSDFNWSQTNALPPALRGAFRSEPFYVDLSRARTEGQLSLRNAEFRNAVASLAARIVGRPKEELVDEDRRHTLTSTIVAVLTLIAALMALSFGIQKIIQYSTSIK